MTGVVNKFQRILGLKIHDNFIQLLPHKEEDRPLILVSHMEHHSNHISWLDTVADLEIIPTRNGLFSLSSLQTLLEKYSSRKFKIAAITAALTLLVSLFLIEKLQN